MKPTIAKVYTTLMAASLIAVAACSGQHESKINDINEDQEIAEDVQDTDVKPIEEGTAVEAYLRLKDALVASNAAQARQIASDLIAMADAHDVPEIVMPATEISTSDNLDAQRVQFQKMSVSLYNSIKEGKATDQTLYKQYCPMAFDNEGAYWLSAQKEVKNPYFGDQMLTCGRTEETLASN